MKAIGICGSPRKNGNTEIVTGHILRAAEEEGIDTELVRLAGLDIRPCTACMVCDKEENCPIKDDLLPVYRIMKAADAIVLTTPVYYGSMTANMKTLMDRTGFIAAHNGRLFEGKVGWTLRGGTPLQSVFYAGSAYLLVSHAWLLCARLYSPEYRFRQRKGRRGE